MPALPTNTARKKAPKKKRKSLSSNVAEEERSDRSDQPAPPDLQERPANVDAAANAVMMANVVMTANAADLAQQVLREPLVLEDFLD
jgi:hypothetical protein